MIDAFYIQMQYYCAWIELNLTPIDEVYENGVIHYY